MIKILLVNGQGVILVSISEYILIVCSLNCEGINRSKDFINNFLTDNACDILCLQETWTIDSNINILGNIHNDFLFTGISGVDHTVDILQGRPKGGVSILYKNN